MEGAGFPPRRGSDIRLTSHGRRAVNGIPMAIRRLQKRYRRIEEWFKNGTVDVSNSCVQMDNSGLPRKISAQVGTIGVLL